MTQIIFNSQEEFEDAVMTVIKNRLFINLDSETGYDSDYSRVEVTLADGKDNGYFCYGSTTI